MSVLLPFQQLQVPWPAVLPVGLGCTLQGPALLLEGKLQTTSWGVRVQRPVRAAPQRGSQWPITRGVFWACEVGGIPLEVAGRFSGKTEPEGNKKEVQVGGHCWKSLLVTSRPRERLSSTPKLSPPPQ